MAKHAVGPGQRGRRSGSYFALVAGAVGSAIVGVVGTIAAIVDGNLGATALSVAVFLSSIIYYKLWRLMHG